MPKNIKIAITIVVILLSFSFTNSVYNNGINIYNDCKEMKLQLDRIEHEQVVTWDAYYLNFIEQSDNVNLTKEGFIELTNIVMSARKDGQNIAWKWVRENQNIPFEEFTHFYKQLSKFISQRFNENLLIENKKLSIVQKQNLLLSTFPNNIYNRFLKIELLEYRVGFISEESLKQFNK